MANGFIDKARITVRAGNGGNGAVAFHREKYIAAGGPDGGDGGNGGSIILKVDDNMSTLMDFRYKRKYVAGNGVDGQGGRKTGKDGESLTIRVPRGTLVRDAESGDIIKDMSDDAPYVLCKGGRGGWGNQHFATPTRQVPRFAKAGLPGESHDVILELKLLADVGLVGFPNVGKSTLLSVVSKAHPKIANYHFTTLYPNLGVVYVDEGVSFVMADIPGIIEGAREGAGRGRAGRRRVGRGRLRIVVGNKTDLVADTEQIDALRAHVESLGYEFFAMSAATHQGTRELVQRIGQRLSELPPVTVYEPEYVPKMPEVDTSDPLHIEREDNTWLVEGPWLQRLMGNINFSDYESRMYFDKMLRQSGLFDRLEEMGIQDGDIVSMYDLEFEYQR